MVIIHISIWGKCILKILLEQQFVAELVTELTPAVKKELKTAHRHMSALVCSFLKRSTLHSRSYFTIPHCGKGHYFNSIFKEHCFKSFQHSPPGDKEDAENPVIRSLRNFCLLTLEPPYKWGLRPLPGLLCEHGRFKSLKINWRISK